MTDLDRFYYLKQRMLKGYELSRLERSEYRTLGRMWISLYKKLGDEKAVKNIRRDMNMVPRQKKRSHDVAHDVML